MDGLLYYQRLYISQMGHVNFKFSSPAMTFQLQDILASPKPYCMISGGYKYEKLLRIMLQHVIYVHVPRFFFIIRTESYAHCQFQRNPGPQNLWIS
jgi:hypothetical protein